MRGSDAAGLLLVSIDLEHSETGKTARQTAELQSVAKRLIALLEHSCIPATWSVSNPAHSDLAALVVNSSAGHEISLLGDSTWVGPQAGRTRFARELGRRVEASRDAGVAISTLALLDTHLEQDLDLLVKHKISIVRDAPGNDSSPGRAIQPHSLRFGVWRAPATIWLPYRRPWWLGGPRLAVRRAIHRACTTGSVIHLAINASLLAAADRRVMDTVEAAFRFAQRRLRQELLVAHTLCHVASRLSRRRVTRGTHSILRRAA